MELDSFFSVDALKDLDWFLREVDMLDEAIIIKDNRPMYRIVRIGSKADRRDTTHVIKRVDLWTAMRQVLLEFPDNSAHAKVIADEINKRGLYCTRSGYPVSAVQIRSRAQRKPQLFKCLKGNIIQLI